MRRWNPQTEVIVGATAIATALLAVAVVAPAGRRRNTVLLAAATGVGALWLLTQTTDVPVAVALGAVIGATAGAVVRSRSGAAAAGRTRRPTPMAVVAVAMAVWLALACWVGANSPTVSWFGRQVSHGRRSQPTVALTFDDGPNDSTTLAVADLLDRAGAKGTFFSVGRAVDARPELARALYDDGHLVENHSYAHDSYRWLDPRYPELDRAERSVQRAVAACPAFYRAPHGQHTPFSSGAVGRAGMTEIGWDVSAGDWATRSASVVAARVLRRVRPGSIIDLHDGLDGRVDVDRTVLVRALPLILDGLAAKGLRPVRLDVLLGRPGYRRCG